MSRSEKVEGTYQRILDVANLLFQKKGYESTSIQDILNDLKMSKGAVYHHFKSKKEILDAIEERRYAELMSGLREMSKNATGRNGLEKIQSVFDHLLDVQQEAASVYDKEHMTAHLDPHTMLADIKSQPVTGQFMTELIKEGVADGSIESDNPEALMEVFFILFGTWLNPLIFPRSSGEFRERMCFLRSIMANMGANFITDSMVNRITAIYETSGYIE